MSKHYYKRKSRNYKIYFKLASIGIVIVGAILSSYVFFPLLSWQFYFAPAFASQNISAPIPSHTLIASSGVVDLLSNAGKAISKDYTDAYNWYPDTKLEGNIKTTYSLSIPKLEIKDAVVTNEDTNLSKHLVQYNSDSIPPNSGNTVIFGHSTLPQLYDPEDYETIFANLYKLEVGDNITTKLSNIEYNYVIESIRVVDPSDTSVLVQNFNDSYLTLVTCTPPGTVWKRLIIKARLANS